MGLRLINTWVKKVFRLWSLEYFINASLWVLQRVPGIHSYNRGCLEHERMVDGKSARRPRMGAARISHSEAVDGFGTVRRVSFSTLSMKSSIWDGKPAHCARPRIAILSVDVS